MEDTQLLELVGGGAGGSSGDTTQSGAGFGGGSAEFIECEIGGENGGSINVEQKRAVGGSYYSTYCNSSYAVGRQKNLFDYKTTGLTEVESESGGIGGGCGYVFAFASQYNNWKNINGVFPDGGVAGKGGSIKVSNSAKVKGYNGSYVTTKDSAKMSDLERQTTQALIYAQAGYDVKAIRELFKVKNVTARTISDLVIEWSKNDYDFTAQRTIKSPYDSTCGTLSNTYVLGIGSGAGSSQEIDGNGTYTIDSGLN